MAGHEGDCYSVLYHVLAKQAQLSFFIVEIIQVQKGYHPPVCFKKNFIANLVYFGGQFSEILFFCRILLLNDTDKADIIKNFVDFIVVSVGFACGRFHVIHNLLYLAEVAEKTLKGGERLIDAF